PALSFWWTRTFSTVTQTSAYSGAAGASVIFTLSVPEPDEPPPPPPQAAMKRVARSRERPRKRVMEGFAECGDGSILDRPSCWRPRRIQHETLMATNGICRPTGGAGADPAPSRVVAGAYRLARSRGYSICVATSSAVRFP